MLEARLTDLEVRVTHQDLTIEDLSEIVRKQWDDIAQLRRDLERQIALVQTMEADNRDAPPVDERPPHY